MAKKKEPVIDPEIIKKFEFHVRFNLKNLLAWGLVIFLGLSFLFSLAAVPPGQRIPLSQALQDIKDGKIAKIEV